MQACLGGKEALRKGLAPGGAAEQRGVTLEQMRKLHVRAKKLCVSEEWRNSNGIRTNPEEICLYDLEISLVRPTLAGRGNVTFVEHVYPAAKQADWLVNVWWGQPVAQIVAALEAHARDRALPDSTSYYIRALCANPQAKDNAQQSSTLYAVADLERMLRGARGTLSILDQRGSAFTHAWWAFELWVSLQQLEGRSDEGGGFRIDLYTPTTQGGAIGLLDGDAPADGADGARMAATRKVVRERAFPRAWLGRAAISFSLAMLVTSRPHECDVLVQLMTDADAEATLRAYLATCILARGPASERALSLGAGAAAAAGGVGKAAADPSGALIALLDWLGLDALASRCVGGRSQDQYRILNEKAVTAVMLAALRGSQLRRLVAVREVAVEADARRLGAALPASLRSLTLWGLHPAVVGGVARIMRESARVAPLSEPLALGGLRSLELAACGIEAYGAWRLASALSAGSRLERLSLRRNALGDNGARALASALGSHPSLTVLDLSSNGIGDAGGGALARALACRGPGGLGACSLADNRLGAPAGVALGAALLENEALRSLSLGWNRLSNGGVVGLAAGVRASKFLLALELSGNSIGDAGADALADALASNQTLTRLVLQRNVIGDAGCVALAESLHRNGALLHLSLWSNVVQDKGALALARALAANDCLVELNLASNHIEAAGASAFAGALRSNASLTSLNLSSNLCSAASQRQLVAAWRKSRGKGTAAAHLELGLAPSLDAELAESFPRQGSY